MSRNSDDAKEALIHLAPLGEAGVTLSAPTANEIANADNIFGDEDAMKDDAETGGVKALPSPWQPTALEVDEHMVSHCPWRAWCRHCVAGRGKADHHRALEDEWAKQVPTLSLDYCFMGEKDDGNELSAKCMPCLVDIDHKTRWIGSHVVPSKGTIHKYCEEVLAKSIELTGYNSLICKSDGEPAIKELKRAAAKVVRERFSISTYRWKSRQLILCRTTRCASGRSGK